MSETKSYTLTEAERRHIAEVRAQMGDTEGDILKLQGAIYGKQHEMELMRRHLSLYLGAVASGANLPMNVRLSPDGAALIAAVEG